MDHNARLDQITRFLQQHGLTLDYEFDRDCYHIRIVFPGYKPYRGKSYAGESEDQPVKGLLREILKVGRRAKPRRFRMARMKLQR